MTLNYKNSSFLISNLETSHPKGHGKFNDYMNKLYEDVFNNDRPLNDLFRKRLKVDYKEITFFTTCTGLMILFFHTEDIYISVFFSPELDEWGERVYNKADNSITETTFSNLKEDSIIKAIIKAFDILENRAGGQ